MNEDKILLAILSAIVYHGLLTSKTQSSALVDISVGIANSIIREVNRVDAA
jgi:hypothetical protein